MKVIVITSDDKIEIREFSTSQYETLCKAVGGPIEIVHPIGLLRPYCMIVNEEGLLRDLPENRMGSYLYGAQFHGSPIVGDIVILKEGFTTSGPDILPLEDAECEQLFKLLKDYELTPVGEDKNEKGE